MFYPLCSKNNKLVKAILQQIENHRNGEEVDTTLLKGVIDSFGKLSRVAISTSAIDHFLCSISHAWYGR